MRRVIRRGLVATGVAGALCAGAVMVGSVPAQAGARVGAPAAAPAATANRTLLWHDEFTGSRLNPKFWTALNRSTNGVSNGQVDCLLSRAANVKVSRGALWLTSRKEANPITCSPNDPNFPGGRSYTSGFITTKGKKSWTYGRYEMRARLPFGAGTSTGLWPAFWMWPNNNTSGELDIMEAIGREPDRTYAFAHSSTDPNAVSDGGSYVFSGGRNPGDGYHIYALDWEPTYLRWTVDGHVVRTMTSADTPWVASSFTTPMHLMLNMTVGGIWAQDPNSSTRFPATYYVDYVRVYSRAK